MEPALASLLIASLAFVGSHFVLSHPLRAPLVSAIGENGFRLLYSLVALATLVWMAQAFRTVGPGGPSLWDGSGDAVWVGASAIMLLASVLLAGSLVRNPALPAPGAEHHARQAPHGVFHVTRHPMMWSFALWAAVHVALSPAPRQVIVSAAIAILALGGAAAQDAKKRELMGAAWADWSRATAFVPRPAGLARIGIGVWLAGTAIWLAATFGHIHANGIAAGVWRWV